MKMRLLSLCLALCLLLCGCGQNAVTVSPADVPSVPAKQEVPAVTPAAEPTAGKENTPTASVEKENTPTVSAEKAEETAKKVSAVESPVTRPETQTPKADEPSMPETSKTTEPIQPKSEPIPSATASCTISIVCHTAVGKSDAAPADGVILSSTLVTLSGGERVYDVLSRVCSANGIALGGSSGYIKSIGSLAERDCGGGSGWLYRVNGTTPGVGCGSYTVADGDSIEWLYTCDMGNDL